MRGVRVATLDPHSAIVHLHAWRAVTALRPFEYFYDHVRIGSEVRFDDGNRALYATDGSNYRHVPLVWVLPRGVLTT